MNSTNTVVFKGRQDDGGTEINNQFKAMLLDKIFENHPAAQIKKISSKIENTQFIVEITIDPHSVYGRVL